MKLITLACALLILPIFCNAQETDSADKKVETNVDNGKLFFGLSSGVDYYQNAYRETPTTTFTFEEKGPRYNINFEAAYMVNDRFRPRVQIGYHRQVFRQNWISVTTSEAMKYTDVRINYMDLNFMADYLVTGKNAKFQTFVSTGIVTEYKVGYSYYITKNNGEHTSINFSEIGTYFPKCSAGWQSALIFKYKLNNLMGITLSPGYNMYFRKYVTENSNAYQRFNLNLGIEINIH